MFLIVVVYIDNLFDGGIGYVYVGFVKVLGVIFFELL